jgi:hypothetical protein
MVGLEDKNTGNVEGDEDEEDHKSNSSTGSKSRAKAAKKKSCNDEDSSSKIEKDISSIAVTKTMVGSNDSIPSGSDDSSDETSIFDEDEMNKIIKMSPEKTAKSRSYYAMFKIGPYSTYSKSLPFWLDIMNTNSDILWNYKPSALSKTIQAFLHMELVDSSSVHPSVGAKTYEKEIESLGQYLPREKPGDSGDMARRNSNNYYCFTMGGFIDIPKSTKELEAYARERLRGLFACLQSITSKHRGKFTQLYKYYLGERESTVKVGEAFTKKDDFFMAVEKADVMFKIITSLDLWLVDNDIKKVMQILCAGKLWKKLQPMRAIAYHKAAEETKKKKKAKK